MRLVLIGGHLSPALALLDQLSSSDAVLFIGRKFVFEGDATLSLEYTAMRDRHIRFVPLVTGRFQRKLTKHSLPSLTKFPYGYVQALAILLRWKPDIVVGFGGYLSLPVCLAAQTLRIPVVIHEQTFRAGLANRLIGKFAKMICISWNTSKKYFPSHKTILTGSLIRKEILMLAHKTLSLQQSNKKENTLYITGGSSGSHIINQIIEEILSQLLKKYRVIHQTGESKQFNDLPRFLEIQRSLPKDLASKYEVYGYIKPSEIASVYARSTLIIGRSGANTLIELLLLKKPCLLIPLAVGQRGEQLENARFLQEAGLATILEQDIVTKKLLIERIDEMMQNINSYQLKMQFELPLNGSEQFYRILQSLYEKKQSKEPKN